MPSFSSPSGNATLANASMCTTVGGGSPTPPAFVNTKSVRFTRGSNQSVSFGNVLDWTVATPRSFSAWVKLIPPAGNSAIIGKGNINTTGWLIYYASNTLAFVATASGGGEIALTAPAVIADSTWHHVAVTVDGSKTAAGVIIYLDGVALTNTVFIDNLTGSVANSSNLLLGDDPTSDPFNGNMDEPSMWNTVLSASDVAAVYNFGTPVDLILTAPKAANLIGWWRDGDSPDTTSTFFDASTGGHNGTPANIAGADLQSDVP